MRSYINTTFSAQVSFGLLRQEIAVFLWVFLVKGFEN